MAGAAKGQAILFHHQDSDVLGVLRLADGEVASVRWPEEPAEPPYEIDGFFDPMEGFPLSVFRRKGALWIYHHLPIRLDGKLGSRHAVDKDGMAALTLLNGESMVMELGYRALKKPRKRAGGRDADTLDLGLLVHKLIQSKEPVGWFDEYLERRTVAWRAR